MSTSKESPLDFTITFVIEKHYFRKCEKDTVHLLKYPNIHSTGRCHLLDSHHRKNAEALKKCSESFARIRLGKKREKK